MLADGTTKIIPYKPENRFEIEGNDFMVSAGSIIKTFYLKKDDDVKVYPPNKLYSVASSYNYTFDLDSNGFFIGKSY